MEYKQCEQCWECLECHWGVIILWWQEKVMCSCQPCWNMYVYNVQDSELDYDEYDDEI